MQQNKFNDLTLPDKALIIAEYGIFISQQQYYDYRVHLYSLHRNFVEVFYNCLTRHIERITLMTDLRDIDKYLVNITLPRFF